VVLSRVLVTGANGSVGAELVRALAAQGHTVVALGSEADSRHESVGTFIAGTALDPSAMRAAIDGCSLVFHTSAPALADHGRDAAGSTRTVLEAAADAGAMRVVLTSAAQTIGPASGPFTRTEKDWNFASRDAVSMALIDSERTALRLAAERDLHVCIVCPTLAVGANQLKLTRGARLLAGLAARTTPSFPGGVNIVALSDVVATHLAAARHGHPAERYLAAGENLSIEDLAALVADALGSPTTRHLGAPRWLAVPILVTTTWANTLLRRDPSAPPDAISEQVGRWGWVDSHQTRTALDLRPRPATDVIAEALAWAATRGWLPPELARAALERHPPLPAWPKEPQ
jgi:dihydroflavonol-4-reductase